MTDQTGRKQQCSAPAVAALPAPLRPPRVALWKLSAPTIAQCRRGLVVLLSGVEAGCWPLRGVVQGLRDAGEQRAICIYRWQIPGLSLANLWTRGHHAVAARRLSIAIRAFRDRFARPPVDLVAYSAGAIIALRAAAQLPRCGDVRHVVLVQPAVRPRCPLDAALGGISGKLVVFVSRRDRLILGLGTSLFGTADGFFGHAAGRVGFDLKRCVTDATLRPRVEQVVWTPAMPADTWAVCAGRGCGAGWRRGCAKVPGFSRAAGRRRTSRSRCAILRSAACGR